MHHGTLDVPLRCQGCCCIRALLWLGSVLFLLCVLCAFLVCVSRSATSFLCPSMYIRSVCACICVHVHVCVSLYICACMCMYLYGACVGVWAWVCEWFSHRLFDQVQKFRQQLKSDAYKFATARTAQTHLNYQPLGNAHLGTSNGAPRPTGGTVGVGIVGVVVAPRVSTHAPYSRIVPKACGAM